MSQSSQTTFFSAGRQGAERSLSGRAAFRGGCSQALGCGGDRQQPKFCTGPELRSLAHPSLCWVQEGEAADGVVCLGVTGSQGWSCSVRGKGCARCACTRSSLAQPCLRSCSSLGGVLRKNQGSFVSPRAAQGPCSGRGEMAKPAGGGLLSRRTLIP